MALKPRGRRIGLLGGSFNPAHAGHRHISLAALARLGLDEVWWLVSPQNPLKAVAGMAPLADRLAEAGRLARHPRIRPTDIEACLGTRFTYDTLVALRRRFPATRFVWLMGADNLRQLPAWRRWRDLIRLAPIAVFDRPTYSYPALASKAAARLRRARVTGRGGLRALAMSRPPAWAFVWLRRHPASATAIRERGRRGVGNS
ncbi:MAG: nicotinate-nucleotide adenylyltransferase [Alphaproteobacteria bacterium]|nr:nicotinate-nucleotide adenylyltransferase [Alphaproteobacteria bacterium]